MALLRCRLGVADAALTFIDLLQQMAWKHRVTRKVVSIPKAGNGEDVGSWLGFGKEPDP
jgi:hypothetical protein